MLPISFFKLTDANSFFFGGGGGGSYEVDTEVNITNILRYDTLVRRQLFLWSKPFSIPFFFSPVKLCIYTFPGANRHSRKRTQTLLKGKIGFFFCLCSLPSGHPKHNKWLLAMQLVLNFQIKENIIFDRATKRRGPVFVNPRLPAGKQAIHSFDINKGPI